MASDWQDISRRKEIAIRKAGITWGQNYSKAFSAWTKAHHFDRIPAATRSVAIELAEHADEITRWRDGLPLFHKTASS